MKISFPTKTILTLAVAVAAGGMSLTAQQVQHLTITQAGGMPGSPVMTGISQVTNGVRITWDGPSGYYQVLESTNGLSGQWSAWGKATNLNRTATIIGFYSNAFFRVSGPAPKYAGEQVCITCHKNVCSYFTNTPHAHAFQTLEAIGQSANPACVICHTVGYGVKVNGKPVGFVDAATTPQLEGVQCENCHGPAANHAASPDDPSKIPQVDIAAQVCGGCHSGTHNPTFNEWSTSGHAAVVPEVLANMGRSASFIRTCGVCHSGSARLAMLGGYDPAVTKTHDYNMPQTCAVCHDPHATNANPFQLRNPLRSTNNFELTGADTVSPSAFLAKYDANTNINLCAQCHNDRGASWQSTSRAPHHSVQYNFLLGTVGELLSGPATFNPGTHAGLPSSAVYSLSGEYYLTNQCAACHLQDDSSGLANHTFAIAKDTVCMNCHITPPQILEQQYLTPFISNSVSLLLTSLNRWAGMQTNSLLATNGVVAWEYTNPGGLTWQTNASGNVISWSLTNPVSFSGPSSAGQALIPDKIKQARYNMYLVLNDGSFGVHNPTLATKLLNAAQIWMTQVLQ